MKTLSHRECQVVELLCQGWTQKETADKLGIQPGTVRCYLKRVQAKTKSRTIMAAVVQVVFCGMVTINSA